MIFFYFVFLFAKRKHITYTLLKKNYRSSSLNPLKVNMQQIRNINIFHM
jgi:hypothetical protein